MSGLIARLSLSLFSVGTLLIYSALVALPNQPLPLSDTLVEFGFAACELPCWAGITPGQTLMEEVPERYQQHVSTPFRRMDRYAISYQFFATSSNRESIAALARTSSLPQFPLAGRVLELELETPLPMWFLIATLGDPTCVSVEQLTRTLVQMRLTWTSPDYMAEATLFVLDDAQWGMQQQTIDMQIHVPEFYEAISQGRVQGSCESVSNARWLGFAPLSRYMAFLPSL